MSPERWQKINDVFQSVVELELDEQSAYLKKACADDKSLREQVETLLAANNEAGTFIAGNAAKDVGHLLTLENQKTLTGESLGHYEIISILGTGGMGKVYLAKDSKLNRSIAVKTLPNSFSSDSDHVKRLQTEARAAANLNHPNVATIYSVEETDDNQTFITMEYVEGKPLSKMIPESGFDQRTFLDLFISIADALAHAHEKGIVHRDIKPSNIMITPAGEPKILDFGLAQIDRKRLGDEDSTLNLTKTGQVLGTPAYMSPEQAKGEEADHRTDIFSLGVVMYEAITGERPFKGDNYASVVIKLLQKDARNISEIKPEVPYLLSRLIMKCLSKEPRYRYQSMNEVRVLLKEINSAIDSGASLSRPAQKALIPQKNYLPWLIGGVLLLLLATASFFAWNFFQTDDTNTEEITRFHIQPPSTDPSDLFNVRITPDGKNLIFSSKQDEVDMLFIRPLDKFEATPIKGTENGNDPLISPDGEWLAFRYGIKGLRKVPLTGGAPISICDSCDVGSGSDWGTDNMIVYADKTGIHRVSADGGEPERLTTVNKDAGEKSHLSPIFLPDQKGVIFTISKKNKRSLAVLSLESKELKTLELPGSVGYPKFLKTGHLLYGREEQIFAVPFDVQNLKIAGKSIPVLEGVFSFLPDINISETGTLIYLPAVSLKSNSLVWVDKAGKDSPALKKRGNFFAPKLSPDGKQVAVALNGDIWVFDLNSDRGIRLTTQGKAGYPLWTKDGKSIIYRVVVEDVWTIYKKNANGTGEAEKIHTSDFEVRPYSIHPTKPIVALSAFPAQGKGNIVALYFEDGTTKNLVKAPFIADMPNFSPDGKWLAYFATESGNNQIFIQPLEGDSSERFLVSKQTGIAPVWARDGKKIFYRTVNNFYSADVQTEPEVKFGDVNFLFKGNLRTNFDLSLDSEKFLIVKSEKGVFPQRLNVVKNWTQEFKQIVDSAK